MATVKETFDAMSARFRPDKAAGTNATIQYDVSGDNGGTWHAVIKDGTCTVNPGPATNPNLTLQIAGLADEGRSSVRRELGQGAFIIFHLAEDGRLAAASGIGTGNAVAKDIRIAEMLIGRGAHPDPGALAHPETRLKSLLAA